MVRPQRVVLRQGRPPPPRLRRVRRSFSEGGRPSREARKARGGARLRWSRRFSGDQLRRGLAV